MLYDQEHDRTHRQHPRRSPAQERPRLRRPVERIKIAERTQRGLRKLLEGGTLPCSGYVKFGYSWDRENRTRIIDQRCSPIVVRIFVMAAAGHTLREICDTLNAEQVPTPLEFLGKPRGQSGWIKNTLRNILKDRSYHGEPFQWKSQELGPGTPGLVDRILWERAQAHHKLRSYSTKPGTRSWLLAGLVYCKCGG